jgi:hypothetical protein
MLESGLSGSVRGVPSNGHPYRDPRIDRGHYARGGRASGDCVANGQLGGRRHPEQVDDDLVERNGPSLQLSEARGCVLGGNAEVQVFWKRPEIGQPTGGLEKVQKRHLPSGAGSVVSRSMM